MTLYEQLENAAALMRTYAERELADKPSIAPQFIDRAEQLESYMVRMRHGVVPLSVHQRARASLANFEGFINIAMLARLAAETKAST